MLPKLLKIETILIAWSYILTKSFDIDELKFNVIVYNKDMPTKIPWKKVVNLFILCSMLSNKSFIYVSKEFVVYICYYYFSLELYFIYIYEICVNYPVLISKI